MPATCKHCRVLSVSRPRGLCWGCYYRPGVKDLYPVCKNTAPGPGNVNCNAPLPARPTKAQPGTRHKLAVLAERLKRSESLWHPDDGKTFDAPPIPLKPLDVFRAEVRACREAQERHRRSAQGVRGELKGGCRRRHQIRG